MSIRHSPIQGHRQMTGTFSTEDRGFDTVLTRSSSRSTHAGVEGMLKPTKEELCPYHRHVVTRLHVSLSRACRPRGMTHVPKRPSCQRRGVWRLLARNGGYPLAQGSSQSWRRYAYFSNFTHMPCGARSAGGIQMGKSDSLARSGSGDLLMT